MIRICIAVLAAFIATGGRTSDAEDKPKFNVLFIAIDDLNAKVGCYGAPVKTPNIDRLAKMGRRFDRAYCQYPLCNPSRTSMLSGLRPETTKVWGNQQQPRPLNEHAVWLQEYFYDHGYMTARVGKIYHARFEDEFHWDIPQAGAAGPAARRQAAQTSQPAAANNGQQRPRRGGGGGGRGAGRRANQTAGEGTGAGAAARAANGEGGGDEGEGGGVVPITWNGNNHDDAQEPDGRTARRVVELLEQHKDGPFFIGAGFVKPHLPWNCPKKYFDMYPPDSIHFDEEPPDHLKAIPPIARVPVTPKDPHTPEERRQAMAAYYACTTFVDTQIQLIFDVMDRLKLWDNTIVVIWGDHGWQLGEHGLWRKMALFEESDRAPLIIYVPGMPEPGVATTQLAEFVDIYPTLIELCGLPPVSGTQATSLVPIIKDPQRAVISAAFTSVQRGKTLGKSVRTDRYRYNVWPNGSKELYDHQADPHEYKNLVNDPEHQDVLKKMEQTLDAGYEAAVLKSAS